MTKRIARSLIITPCVIAVACLSGQSAREEAPSNWKSLEQRYAEASLELANARLAMAQSQNKAVAGTVSKQTMNELQSGVQVARDRAKQLAVNQNANSFSPQITAVEGAIQTLEADYDEAIKANQLQAGAVPDVELRREQAEINVAKVRLAALKMLPQQSPQARVEWEIRMLQDDIHALWARPLIED
jgi:predicted outer membrane protein